MATMTTVRRPAALGERVTQPPYAPYNVVAAFPDMPSAREAIEALGAAGIDGNDISLTGPAARETAEREETREGETRLFRHVLLHAAVKSAIGAVIGVVLGALFGWLIVLPLMDAQVSLINVVACAAFGGFIGSIPGALVGYMSSLQPNEPWMLTFQESARGAAIVGVHTEHKEQVDKAVGILRERSQNVHLVDRNGRSIR
jgi:hypothetical protein